MRDVRETIAKTVGDHYDGYVDPNDTPNTWGSATSAADTILAALADEGYCIVPKEPTKEMALAGEDAVGEVVDWTTDTDGSYVIVDAMRWATVAYAAMIAAHQEGNK